MPSTLPSRTITPCPSRSASTSTCGPARSIHGARMKIAGNGSGPSTGIARSTSADSFCRPNALRRTRDVDEVERRLLEPATSCAATIMPMHVPQSGMPARTRATIGAARSKRASSFITVVDSPPGTISAVDALEIGGVFTGSGGRARALQRRDVFDDVALQREYADERDASSRKRFLIPARRQ